jgi:threonine/homoserine/homoserine lactone efflux protein
MINIASGLILGMVYVAAPGPIGMETLRQGVKGGLRTSLAVQAGSSIGLVLYALLALLGAGLLVQGMVWQVGIGVCGTAVLFYLGLTTIREGHSLVRQTNGDSASRLSVRRAFGRGALLSLSNPLEILFWLALGNRVLYDPTLNVPVFLTAFFLGCVLTSLLLVTFASFWQSRLNAKAVLALSWTCGLTLMAFGLKLGLAVGQNFTRP